MLHIWYARRFDIDRPQFLQIAYQSRDHLLFEIWSSFTFKCSNWTKIENSNSLKVDQNLNPINMFIRGLTTKFANQWSTIMKSSFILGKIQWFEISWADLGQEPFGFGQGWSLAVKLNVKSLASPYVTELVFSVIMLTLQNTVLQSNEIPIMGPVNHSMNWGCRRKQFEDYNNADTTRLIMTYQGMPQQLTLRPA